MYSSSFSGVLGNFGRLFPGPQFRGVLESAFSLIGINSAAEGQNMSCSVCTVAGLGCSLILYCILFTVM